MKMKIGFIVLLLCSMSVYAQKSNYFKVNAEKEYVFLRPKTGGMFRGVQPPYDIPISLQKEKAAFKDIQNLLKEKFPEVNDEDFKILKRVVYKVCFSGEGKVTYYDIAFPSQHIDSFPRFEERLYEVGETLSGWDFSKYGLNIYSPDEVAKRIGVISFPLLWLRSK